MTPPERRARVLTRFPENYGAEGAPTHPIEQAERERRSMWRAFDRDPRAFVTLPHGRKAARLDASE